MSTGIIDSGNGFVTVKVSGKLSEAELHSLQRKVADAIQQDGTVKLLVVLENFAGWDRGSWSDLSFQLEHDRQIEKMAIVGDRKWKDMALIFTAQGLRKFPIEYFEPAERHKALAWLGKTASQIPARQSA